MIWLLFGIMLLAAALFVGWPLYRRERRLSAPLIGSVMVVLALSAVLYARVGRPVPPEQPASIDEMMASLEQRLAREPENLDGWKLLGRSHMQLGNYAEAVRAYERAVELESA
ncbi:MAG TPA: tetratricopeptide repeat protein, partial [Woeseiaceae bacterium]|nr:tetratricopeptide repeat protein [Woeseiaceae bacterium]